MGSFYLKIRDEKRIAILFVILYLIIFGLSIRFGVDWYEYENSFYNSGNNYFEPGYVVLENFFSSIGFDYYIFQLILKIVFWVTCIKLIFKYSSNFSFSIFLYFMLSTVFLQDFIRQQAAAIFVFVALIRIEKGFLQFFLAVILGSFFHKSALFVLPFFFIYKNNKIENLFIAVVVVAFVLSLKNISLMRIISGVLSSVLSSELSERLVFYSKLTSSEMTAGRFIRFILFIFFVINIKIIKNNCITNKQRVVFISVLMMFGYEMIFYDVLPIWSRVREYFVALLPALFFIIFDKGWMRFFSSLFIFFYSCYTFLGIYLVNPLLFNSYTYYNNYIYCEMVDCKSYMKIKYEDVEYYWDNYWIDERK